ncbi:hypothetical protein DENIS_0891 [Desulfonema ishimotonii]|uniref:Uncharacterized protein n=1 Tax=Desulfonema ishimotonii TaxID=45657 RepID=A0A401FSK5_9BACT|nr:DUF4288 domain-containing protein [Desulfonema ishimotonii]GBC59949.1 hypothetical protein DENIS_0891 [Desulfonema ishimotonii]
MSDKKEFYSAKCLFKFERLRDEDGRIKYEERITLFKATGFDNAIIIAEQEAEKYAEKEGGEYLGFINVYKLYGKKMSKICEVYSCMRKSELGEDDYLDRYYDTGDECGSVYEKLSSKDIRLILTDKQEMSANMALIIKQMHIVEKKIFSDMLKDLIDDPDEKYLVDAERIGKKLLAKALFILESLHQSKQA